MKTILTLILAAALASVAFGQANLEASGEKRVTLGSEIRRGADAVLNLPRDESLAGALGNYYSLINRNVQASTDTPGFLLGAKYRSWMMLEIAIRVRLGSKEITEDRKTFEIAIEQADADFKAFRAKQRELGITDEQFAAVLEIPVANFRRGITAKEGSMRPSVQR